MTYIAEVSLEETSWVEVFTLEAKDEIAAVENAAQRGWESMNHGRNRLKSLKINLREEVSGVYVWEGRAKPQLSFILSGVDPVYEILRSNGNT